MTRRYSKPPSQRQLKVSELLRSEIMSLIMRGDLYHPALEGAMITVAEVRVSPDLRVATAFTTITNGDEQVCLDALNEISPMIRSDIFPKLSLKYSPEIRFIIDKSMIESGNIESLLNKISKKD